MAILVIFGILAVTYWIAKIWMRFRLGNQFPGPPAIPILGNFQFIGLSPEGLFAKLSEIQFQHQRYFRLWLGPSLWIFLNNPKDAEIVLNDNKIPKPIDFQYLSPLIGNGLLVSEELFFQLNVLQKRYRRYFRIWFGTNLWIFLSHPKDVAEILNDPRLPRPSEFKFLSLLIGDGLAASNGKKWYFRRKALTPAFQVRMLEYFSQTFSRNADILAEKLQNTDTVEISSYLLYCMLDAICETAMGVKIDSQTNPSCDYVAAFHDASRILFRRMANPLLRFKWIFQLTQDARRVEHAIEVIHDLADKVIRTKRSEMEAMAEEVKEEEEEEEVEENDIGRKPALTLIDILLRKSVEGRPLCDEEIREEVNTFLFAGVDTTKSATSFILYNIAKYPAVQKRLVNEISSYVGSPTEDVTVMQIHHMKFLDAVVKESLRFHTPVPVTGRQTTQEMVINHLTVPRNTTLWVNIYGMCHDPNLFESPGEFIPERFMRTEVPPSLKKSDPSSFIPFSSGPHTCIGKRYALLLAKIITVKLLLNFEISLARPDEQLQYISEMVLKSKTGVNLKFRPRPSEL